MRRMLLLLMLAWGAGAVAQPRFEEVRHRNPWNDGANAAGVRADSLSRSYAEAYFTKQNGGWIDHSGSDDSWNAGARTASIRHFERVSFFGGFSYDYFEGRNMCGSMLSRPGYYPVDILEFTPGRKVRETYAFTGGLAVRLHRRWTAGLRMDFEAQNYAKRRDLRHKNTMLDFRVAPGILYEAGRLRAGAAYLFGKNSDRAEAEQIGLKGTSYYAFFDKGLYYGTQELWDGNNIHLKESGIDGFPLKELMHGVAAQLQYGAAYAEATYGRTHGDTGEKDLTWHEFEGERAAVRGVVTLPDGGRLHIVRAGFEWYRQDNREMLVGKENVDGVTTNRIYGSTPVFGRRGARASGEYELSAERAVLRAGGSYTQIERRSTLRYPETRGQELHFTECFVRGRRSWGRFDLELGLDCRWGGSEEKSLRSMQLWGKWEPVYRPLGIDGGLLFRSDDTTVAGDGYPQQLTDYYEREREWLTATRMGVDAGVRCHIRRFYIDVSGRYERGFGVRCTPGAQRGTLTLGVGYDF